MTILITGSTGTIGKLVTERVAGQGPAVKALVREEKDWKGPDGVTPVKGDLIDPALMRAALKGVDTLFLLNAVVKDELTQALITLNLAREAGIRRIVY
ncbi:MAG: NmrA family NAD(P)-binding protein, partial [Caulobacteraceae bacterium]|nr:NmrA family NAD(P)-binding protein [Caulobacter sp.]